MQPYDENFFAAIEEGSQASAQEVVPLVLRLLAECHSVIDIGCGMGEWLAVFRENGVEEILGVDGDYVERKMLKIAPEKFLPHDLQKPFEIDRKFDLAMSLEVAEHLPESSAKVFVESLTNLAPVVLFSASIPHQEGTHHINEQWSDYWAQMFERENFAAIDCLRLQLWNNRRVEWWYKQNILIFAERKYLPKYPRLAELYRENSAVLPLVHPELLLHHVNKNKQLSGKLDKLNRSPAKFLLKFAEKMRRRLRKK